MKKIALIFFPLIGMALLVYGTVLGPGVGGDATVYLFSAKNLAEGYGLGLLQPDGGFQPLTYYPPLFSLVLTPFGLLGMDSTDVARCLNIALFGGLLLLVGGWFQQQNFSLVHALLAQAYLAFSPILLPVYSWAMAEPLAILLGFSSLVLLSGGLGRNTGSCWFYLSAILAGLSFLTRYACVAFLLVGGLGVFWMLTGAFWSRLRRSLLYLGIGSFLPALWLLYVFLQTRSLAARSPVVFNKVANRLAEIGPVLNRSLLSWVLPESWITSGVFPGWLQAILAGLIIMLVIFIPTWRIYKIRQQGGVAERINGNQSMLVHLLSFFGIYFTVAVGSYLFAYPLIDLDNRILSPAYLAGLWALVVSICIMGHDRWRSDWIGKSALIGLGLAAVWFGLRSNSIIRYNHLEGLGFNSRYWRASPVMTELRKLPVDTPIVTNEVLAVLYQTGRTSYAFQEIYLKEPFPQWTRYGEGDLRSDPGQAAFRTRHAALVLFEHIQDELSLVYGNMAQARLFNLTEGLEQSFWGSDGFIYYYPED